MARAAYIIKKDGRYWFQKRFAVVEQTSGELSSHCRVALRTSEYRVAVSRMLRVAQMVQEFEIQPDVSSRARALMEDMQRLNARMDPDSLVQRRALETLVSRLITEARFRDHPLATDPSGFWTAWMGFVNASTLLEAAKGASSNGGHVAPAAPQIFQTVLCPQQRRRRDSRPLPKRVRTKLANSTAAPDFRRFGARFWSRDALPMVMDEPRKTRASLFSF